LAPYGGGVQGAQYGPNKSDSTMLIDATLKRPMPPLALPGREYMEGALKIWRELGLPPVDEKSPWHGYTLGDWAPRWESYAKRAVAGDWEQSGVETYARRKGGLKPESPYRTGEETQGKGTAEE
jgi:4-hydroxy-3-polyprenylbenzoate decarboxylase